MTISPYRFYSDQFINVIYRHDFDPTLYRLQSGESTVSSAPYICLQYNLLYGTLAHPEVQQGVTFSIPYNTYNEFGLLLKNLVKIRYATLYYLTLDFGYFYHPTDTFDAQANGRYVFGANFEL